MSRLRDAITRSLKIAYDELVYETTFPRNEVAGVMELGGLVTLIASNISKGAMNYACITPVDVGGLTVAMGGTALHTGYNLKNTRFVGTTLAGFTYSAIAIGSYFIGKKLGGNS